MYDIPYHKEKDGQVIGAFIENYPFAFLTGCDAMNRPVATQLPMFIEERNGRKFLSGHIMKNTDHHRAFAQNKNVLVVFSGPNVYVSGTWYTNPHTPSTWNYMSVHMKGVIRYLDDEALIEALRKISLHYENYNRQAATIYDNLPADYTRRLISMIVAFEIEVTEMDTVFKLSQDRDAGSYRNIISKLRQQGESGQVIAEEMEKRFAQVFPGGRTANG